MSKISHCVSEILPETQSVEEEVVQRTEKPETLDDDKVSMTRVIFKSIMTKALEDQKNLADATSAQAVKVAITKGIKHGSELQTQPLHSTTIEPETVRHIVEQSPIMPFEENGLNAVHKLRPGICNAIGPSVVNLATPVQSAAKLPVFSTNTGVIDGNKTFQTVNIFTTEKRYKRETILKFSEGSVDTYESFGSQFNIHHKMLGWDTPRAGIELYMGLAGKAALKVEEFIMNAESTSNIIEMWDALDHAFLPIDHRESKYRQFDM